MSALNHPIAGMSRRLARAVPYRPAHLGFRCGIVSFSFDDFPLSAAENAAPILEAAGVLGTFYFADGLADRDENGQRIAGIDIARDLARRGHELGGHTSAHLNVQRTPPDQLIADVTANTSAIAALSGQAPTSFAYPFGVVSLRSKHLLAHRYAGLRGIQPGINRGWVDLAHLRAQELYDATLTPALLAALLDDLQARGGWLIFYTHDVRPDPSSIGCSPELFADVVRQVQARDLAIHTVASVLTGMGVNARGG